MKAGCLPTGTLHTGLPGEGVAGEVGLSGEEGGVADVFEVL